ncbi:hypothetical protein NEUTE2DRAFT_127079 [Neurospora tetrasperma FGSC 2509]|nr:hypothetical protein NEUTE2DRAFT_127079 [Neurospora tetrasperma FGSC 2509]
MFCSSIHVRDRFSWSPWHSPTTRELWRGHTSVQVSGMESERFRQYGRLTPVRDGVHVAKKTNEKTSATRNTKTSVRLRQVEAGHGRRFRMSTINSDSISVVTSRERLRSRSRYWPGGSWSSTSRKSFLEEPSSEPLSSERMLLALFISCWDTGVASVSQFSTVSYCTPISLSRPLCPGANQGVDHQKSNTAVGTFCTDTYQRSK